MGCEVYANGDEIACKAGDGKVIAAFPDVCLTPCPTSRPDPGAVPRHILLQGHEEGQQDGEDQEKGSHVKGPLLLQDLPSR